MKIHIVIPVHNNCRITLECLRLLSLQTWKNFDVTVTDDGSTDGTYEAIRQRFPDVTVLRGDGNLWWTGAINMALEYILPRAADDDYILTLNNDVTFREDYLANLAEAANMRPGWLIGSVSLDKNDPERIIDAGIYFDWRTRKRLSHQPFEQGRHFNDYVNRLSGKGVLIPTAVFRRIGLYDTRCLPHYAADAELTVRAERAGFALCVYCGAILHSDRSISGLRYTPFMKLSFGEARNLLFSRKSVSQVKTRFNITLLCCPREYLIRNLLTETMNVLQIITSVKPLWYLKVLFYPMGKLIQRKTKKSWAKSKGIGTAQSNSFNL